MLCTSRLSCAQCTSAIALYFERYTTALVAFFVVVSRRLSIVQQEKEMTENILTVVSFQPQKHSKVHI